MTKQIKGITIEIGAETKGFKSGLAELNQSSRNLQTELKTVDRALKLDPKNTEMLTQKQDVLTKAIEETKKKVEILKETKEKADKEMESGTEINQEEYRKLQREIAFTETNLKNLENQVGNSNEKLEKIAEKTEKIAKRKEKIVEVLNNLKKAAIGFVTSVGAGFTVMVGMANKSAKVTDDIDKMSQKIGVSKQAYQELDFVMSQSGASVDSLQAGMKTLVGAIDNNSKAFDTLGVGTRNSDGSMKDAETVMWDTFTALQNVENQTEKARLANELFGRSGSELMPLLNGASGSIEEMREKAHELGLVLSDDSVDAGVAYTDMVDQLKRSFSTVVTEIGTQLMPVLLELGQYITENMPAIKETISKIMTVISSVIRATIEVIQKIIEAVKEFVAKCQDTETDVGKAWEEIKNVIKGILQAIGEIIEKAVEFFTKLWENWGDTITIYLSGVWKFIKIVVDTALKLIQNTISTITALISGDWEGVWEGIKSTFSTIWNGIKELLENSLKGIHEIIVNVGEKIKAKFLEIWESIKNSFKESWDSICKWFETKITKIVDTVVSVRNKMFEAGKRIFTGLWEGIKNVWSNISSWVSEKVNWLVDKLTFWKKDDEKSNNNQGRMANNSRSSLGNATFSNSRSILQQVQNITPNHSTTKKPDNQSRANANITQNFYGVKEERTAFQVNRQTKQTLRGLGLA